MNRIDDLGDHDQDGWDLDKPAQSVLSPGRLNRGSCAHTGLAQLMRTTVCAAFVMTAIRPRLLERGPCLDAKLVAPFLVEAGLGQSRAEGGLVRAFEDEALLDEFVLQRGVEVGAVLALLDRRAIEFVTRISRIFSGRLVKARRLAISQNGSQMWFVSETYFCTS